MSNKSIKVRVIRSFGAKVGNDIIVASEGDVIVMPANQDWEKAGLVQILDKNEREVLMSDKHIEKAVTSEKIERAVSVETAKPEK